MNIESIKNYRLVSDLVATGGQPTEEQLEAIADEGFELVINLATFHPDSSLENEEHSVHDLGMEYINIPVVWAGPSRGDFEQFVSAMDDAQGRRIFVHCAANYRVTAFYALYALAKAVWSRNESVSFIRSLWDPAEYPVWDRFIDETMHHIESNATDR